jgi:hypothetical protein
MAMVYDRHYLLTVGLPTYKDFRYHVNVLQSQFICIPLFLCLADALLYFPVFMSLLSCLTTF